MKSFGVRELDAEETLIVNGGGDIGYFSLGYGNHGNSLLYVAETGANAIKLVANAGIWVYNLF